MITEQQKVDLQWLWLNGWPVHAAARHLGVAGGSAARIINRVKALMARDGRQWPRTLPPEQRPVFGHSVPPRTVAKPSPQPTTPPSAAPPPVGGVQAKPCPRRRPPPLEEQLARIAAGARLTRTFKPARPDHPFTLGGVGSSLL